MNLKKLNETLEESIEILSDNKVRNPKTGRMVGQRYLRKVIAKEHETIGNLGFEKLETFVKHKKKRMKKISEAEDFRTLKRGKAEKLMRTILDKHTKGVFKDEHWAPWHKILDDFVDHKVDYTIDKTEYYKHPSTKDEMPDGKRWMLTVYHGEKGGWKVNITASFGPSKPGDTDKYDMIYTINWLGRLRKPKD